MRIISISLVIFFVFIGTALAGGETLYKKCQSCHGKSGEKIALKVSPKLKGQSQQSIIDKLKGYKTKSYGGVKKNIMERQAAKLSDADMNALAEYIATF